MVQWISVNKATNEIFGVTSSGAPSAPPHTTDTLHVEASQKVVDDYRDMRAQIRAGGRTGQPKWDGTNVVVDADTRTVVTVSANATEISLGSPITITFTSTSNPNFSGSRNVEIMGKLVKLSFTNGTAVKSWSPRESGVYTIKSTHVFKVAAPLTFTVVE